jgi:YidC/Oxa1 family membrane protein insertase
LEIINTIFGIPLGYLLYFCYQLVGNYGIAILIFTLLTKVILFPLSLVAQKNSIVMVKIQPALEDIKQRYAGNNTLVLDEQKKLYKQEHYSTLKNVLPLLIQIPIILGLINVIYNPLQHLLHLDPQMISALVAQTSEFMQVSVDQLGAGAQLAVMELAQSDPTALVAVPDSAAALAQIVSIDMYFLGVDMAEVPTWTSFTIVYPFLSGLSALVLCMFQNKYNVLQVNQGFWGKWGTAIFLVAFSFYFALVLPCGVGLYWIVGNLLSMVVLALCNLVYDPRKIIDYSLLPKKVKLTRAERREQRELNRRMRARERADERRFTQTPSKQLVFYSEASGFYKYFERLIAWLLKNTNITIHYVTSDFNDRIFDDENPRIEKYYIGPTTLIAFMMKLDADMVVMTTPDLETFHIKRSLVRPDIEYAYIDHGMGSFHLMLREHALDNFDTIFCYGPNHVAETRKTEEVYGLPEKQLVRTGFGLFDSMIERMAAMPPLSNDPPVALVAPSWQKDNLVELCLAQTIKPLLASGFKVIVRPHPEYVKRFRPQLDSVIDHYAEEVASGSLYFETDFSSMETVYNSDVVITDWSTIAMEYSFTTKKPSIFIDTPMKTMNPNWENLDLAPLEIALRTRIGVALEIAELGDIGEVTRALMAEKDQWRQRIDDVFRETMYDIGHGGEGAGRYIEAALAEYELAREGRLERTGQLTDSVPEAGVSLA